MLMCPSLQRQLMAWVAAGALSLLAAGTCLAADCGCETPCDSYPVAASGCDCGGSPSHAHHASHLAKGFRSFQESMKKLCELKWCDWKLGAHRDAVCDDACDAMMMGDLMTPMPGAIYHEEMHHHAHPAPMHDHDAVPAQELPSPRSSELSPPVHQHEPRLDSDLFDSLSDPFSDDDAQVQTEKRIRRSSHDEVVLRPVPRKPLSKSAPSSSRRASSVR